MSLEWRADPPVLSVATPSSQVIVELVHRSAAVSGRKPRLHLAVVGEFEPCAAAAAAFDGASVLAPSTGVAGFRSVRQALDAVAASDAEHVVVLVSRVSNEPEDPLFERADDLSERGTVLDFACAVPEVDAGPLLRLATRTGGELLHCSGLPARAAARLGTLRVAPCSTLVFEASLALDVESQRLYRSSPAPRAVDAVSYDEERRTLRWLGGVAPAGAPLGFTLLLNVPRRRHGAYRLMEARVYAGDELLATAEPVIRASLDPLETAVTEPGPTAAWERGETAWLAEEAGRAFRAGDGRMVSMVLDRLVRQLAGAGRQELAERSWRTRVAFLQSGTLSVPALNEIRRALAEPA